MPPRRVHHNFPVPPVTIQTCQLVKGKMNHSYRDCSRVPPPAADRVAAPRCIKDMTFSQKVHDMLRKAAQYGHMIAWMPHGRAFKVLQPQLFEKHLCPLYFGHGRYSSFLRSLNNFGFKHLSRGPDRNCYYHEFMLRGKFHLTRYMPPKRDARRLVADPDSELDFYLLSERFPLVEDDQYPNVVVADPPLPAGQPSMPPVMAHATNTTSTSTTTVTSPPRSLPSPTDLVLQLLRQQQQQQRQIVPLPQSAPLAPPLADVATTLLKVLLEQRQQQPKYTTPTPPPLPLLLNNTTTTNTTTTLDQLILWSVTGQRPPAPVSTIHHDEASQPNKENNLTHAAVALLVQRLLSQKRQ